MGARWEQGPASAGSQSLGKRRGRGERCQRSLSHLRDGPRLAACWPGQVLAPGLGDLGQGSSEKSCATGTPRAGGCQGGAGRHRGCGGRNPTTQSSRPAWLQAVFFFPFTPSPSRLLAQCPAHLAAGRGAPQEGRQGAPGGSGAALAHAPGPGAVQLPRPQLALLRARPCTRLLNRVGAGPR